MRWRVRFLTTVLLLCSLPVFAQMPIREKRRPAGRDPKPDPSVIAPRPTPKPIRIGKPAPKPDTDLSPEMAKKRHEANLDAVPQAVLESLRSRRFNTSLQDSSLHRPATSATARTIHIQFPRPAPRPSSPTLAADPLPVLVRPAKTDDPANVIVAVVSGEHMTLKELQEKLAMMPARTFAGTRQEAEARRKRYMWRILADWVDCKLLAVEAMRRGLSVTKAEIDQHIEGTAKDRGMQISVAARCRMVGISEDELRKTVADAALGDKLIRQMIRESVSDEYLRELVKDLPLLSWAPPRRQVRQIVYLFTVGQNNSVVDTLKEINAKRRKMQSIRRRLVWFGGKFEDYQPNPVEAQVSKEPVPMLCDVGWLTFSEAINPQRQAIYNEVFRAKPPKAGKPPEWALEMGKISDVIQSPFGFHILQVVTEEPARLKTLQELRTEAEGLCYQEVRRELLKQLKTKYGDVLRVNPDGLIERELAAVNLKK